MERDVTSVSVANSDLIEAKPFRFTNKVLVSPLQGLPAAITFAAETKEIAQIRVFFEIDGELLVVPLQYFKMADVYHGTFPTPQETLTYRFQIILPDGKAYLSESYAVNPQCDDSNIEKLLRGANFYPRQADKVREAIKLGRRRATLEYIKLTLLGVLKEGSISKDERAVKDGAAK